MVFTLTFSDVESTKLSSEIYSSIIRSAELALAGFLANEDKSGFLCS